MKSPAPQDLIQTLKARFEKHMQRHKGVSWEKVQAKLEASNAALRSLGELELSGGEPDVIGNDKKSICRFNASQWVVAVDCHSMDRRGFWP